MFIYLHLWTTSPYKQKLQASWIFVTSVYTLRCLINQHGHVTGYGKDKWIETHDKQGIWSYIYWTLHHLDSWIKTDQLDVTCFIIPLFTAQHVSNVNTSIFRNLRLIVDLFHVLYCSGSMCVDVTVWFGWGGVVSLCRLKQSFSLHKDTTPPQPNHTVTSTHIEPQQYNTWNKSTISRKLLKMDVLTF